MRKLLFIALGCVVGSTAFAQQLVANGQFSTVDETGWTLQAASSGSDQGVATTSGDPGNAQYGPAGYAWYGAAVSTHDDVLYQTISTVAGHSYTYVVNYINEDTVESNMDVWWNTSTFVAGGGNEFSMTNPGTSGVWEQLSFNVTATGSSTVIGIGAYNIPSAIYITDVGVTPSGTPEPASVAALGLGALVLVRRRRNRS